MDKKIQEARRAKRQRFLILCAIAGEVCELLESKGVAQHEGCTVRRLAEDMWHSSGDLRVSNMCEDRPETATIGG